MAAILLAPRVAHAQPDTEDETGTRFAWKPALAQSGLFLAVQHSGRLVQEKTRRELGGPFFADYFESVSNTRTWSDQDGILTNYAGHPMVVTPAGGFGLIVFEDWVDKRFISRCESSPVKTRVLRIVMNPNRAVANLLRLKRPSYRDTRP